MTLALRVRRLLLVLVVILGGAVTSAPARADDWTGFGFGPSGARLSSERSGPGFAAAWKHDVQSGDEPAYRALFASPAVADGVVVFGTQRDLVRALREDDGKPLWQARVGGAIVASPAVSRGWAYVLGANQQLYALRLADGSVAWQTAVGGIGQASPTVMGDDLFVATGHPAPRVMRIDAPTGKVIWQTGEEHLHQAVSAPLVIAEGRVLVAETGGHCHSFSVETGAWQWTAETPGIVGQAAPLVIDQRVYLLPGGEEAQIHALALGTGAKLEGWPVTIAPPADGLGAARLIRREHVVSSLAAADNALLFVIRFDERGAPSSVDGPEDFVSRELVMAVDATSGQSLWSQPNGRRETTTESALPSHGFTSTPALYRTGSGQLLAATTSSLDATLRVLAAKDGAELWTTALGAATRSSPVFANGRLVLGTDAGVVHSFDSQLNQAPVPGTLGFSPAGGELIAVNAATLRWGAAIDREGDEVRYQVRLDDDGELLHDWDLEVITAQQAQDVSGRLLAGQVYTFAVRARDDFGAWSAWSRSETFRAIKVPDVKLDGQAVGNLAAALAAARPGSTITIGPGSLPLTQTLALPAGVTLSGAGPHLTVLAGAKGLPVAVAAGAGSTLSQLTVAGAEVGVSVAGATGVRLHNVILRDNADAGLRVAADGDAALVSATVARNGIGVDAIGATVVRNALVTQNHLGLRAGTATALSGGFNNVFGNTQQDWSNATPAASDLAQAVSFLPGDADGLQLEAAQPSTDRGDPSDDFAQEPAPNGGRINIGAFGNTMFAELSGTALPDAGAADGSTDAGVEPERPVDPAGCGCTLGGQQRAPGAAALLFVAFLLQRRRRRRS